MVPLEEHKFLILIYSSLSANSITFMILYPVSEFFVYPKIMNMFSMLSQRNFLKCIFYHIKMHSPPGINYLSMVWHHNIILPLDQNILLKRSSSFHCFTIPLVINQVFICAWVSIWILFCSTVLTILVPIIPWCFNYYSYVTLNIQ